MLALLSIIFIIIFGASALILLSGIAIYNRLVQLRTAVKSSWSDVDARLGKRYDLVAGLVATAEGHAAYGKEIFENVVRAGSSAMKASAPADRAKTEDMFSETLKRFFAFAETYPELKTDANFLGLQSQLREVEDSIEYARRDFNAAVRAYNLATGTFPSSIIASSFGFGKKEFFEPEEPART